MRQPYGEAFEGYDYDLEEWAEPQPAKTSHSEERDEMMPGGSDLFSAWRFPLCPHPPQCVLKGQSGWSVWAGAEGACMQRTSSFELLLNLTGSSVLSRHVVPVLELQHWEEPATPPEIVLDWPDMGVVSLPRRFWEQLVEHLTNTRRKMLVFCVGGHGRTGTAIASLMVSCGWNSSDAISWIRENYCARAIETKEQEEYVRWIGGEGTPPANRPRIY